MKKNWDKQRILDTLKGLDKAGKDLSYNHLARSAQALVSAAAYHFGSYREAVQKAGIDYAEVTRRPRWTTAKIVQMVKKAYRAGEDLHWSAITRRGDELGKAAFASLQPRLFGTWEKALRAAGLDPAKISRYRHWDRKSIIAELKRRAGKKLPLNSGAIQAEDPGAHAAAVRHFGAYDDALRAASLDPAKLRQRRRWSKAEVIAELRTFAKKQGEVKDSLLRRHAPALYGAALRLFKNLTAARRSMEKKSR